MHLRCAPLLWAGLILLGGCIESDTVECSWGAVCPRGFKCDEPTQRCVPVADVCGDGYLDESETCDGSSLRGETCQTLGFTRGTLRCEDCELDTGGCTACGNALCEPGESATTCSQDCGILQVAAGDAHTCAVLADGTVRCWGRNSSFELGSDSLPRSLVPITVPGIDDALSVSVGMRHSCVVTSSGDVYCWGSHEYGQLGAGSVFPENASVPARVPDLPPAVAVAAAERHTCALHADGGVSCWGNNEYGQLGDGAFENHLEASPVSGIEGATDISTQGYTTCVVAEQQIYCWGEGRCGQLGDGLALSSPYPVRVDSPVPFAAVDVASVSTCAVTSQGEAWCWGQSESGQLGNGGDPGLICQECGACERVPVAVALETSATDLSTGGYSGCAVDPQGALWCWGQYMLLNGVATSTSTPFQVETLDGVETVMMGYRHQCAVLTDHTLRCWGQNTHGQLGNDDFQDLATPTRVVGL